MKVENFKIEMGGQEIDDVYPDLAGLEVELDEELAGMFRLRLPLRPEQDGTWKYLDDERFRVWSKVVVTAGLEDDTQELITGYVTHVKPSFEADPTQCLLEVWGLDSSVLMDRADTLQDWPNKKDSDIAEEIFARYEGIVAEVESTPVIHDQAVSTIMQHETDWQFLKRLALRNGFECFVEGTKAHFRAPRPEATPQPVLAVHFGDETNVTHFAIEVNALMPAQVTMFQVDRMSKEVLDATATSSQQETLGATGGDALLGPGMAPGVLVVGQTVTTGVAEMMRLCQGLFHQREWFVTGEGEVAGNQYGVVLKPRGTVTIKGVGETYSGVYYVTHVTHSFSEEGYIQTFRVKRNALLPSGTENFSANGGLGDGLL